MDWTSRGSGKGAGSHERNDRSLRIRIRSDPARMTERIQIERRVPRSRSKPRPKATWTPTPGRGNPANRGNLIQVRGRRDRLWKLIHRAWEARSLPTPDEIGPFFEPGQAPAISPGPLGEAFELLEHQADAHADRLRREADRVAQQASSLANLHKTRQQLEFLEGSGKPASSACGPNCGPVEKHLGQCGS